MRNKIFNIILAGLILAGCSLIPGSAGDSLDGTAWTLITHNGTALIPDSAMTAYFEDGEVSGSASCNRYFGEYQIKNGSILIEGLAWTEMACLNPEGIMEQEQLIMALFSQAEKISIQGQALEISTTSGGLLVFYQIENRE